MISSLQENTANQWTGLLPLVPVGKLVTRLVDVYFKTDEFSEIDF